MIKDTSNMTRDMILKSEYANSTKLRIYIENRLIEYGYKEMSPDKYTIYLSIRKIIKLRFEKLDMLNDESLEEVLDLVDVILPSKSDESCGRPVYHNEDYDTDIYCPRCLYDLYTYYINLGECCNYCPNCGQKLLPYSDLIKNDNKEYYV